MSEATKKRLKAPERRQAFLDAASDLLRTFGIEGLTMERLAARCGVNKALPYRFFSNRDDVLVALFEAESQAFDAAFDERRRPGMNVREEITALIETWVAFMETGRINPVLSMARTANGQLEDLRRSRLRAGLRYFRTIIEQEYELDASTARVCAGILYSSAQGFTYYWKNHRGNSETLVSTYVIMVIGAIEAVVNSELRVESEHLATDEPADTTDTTAWQARQVDA